MKYIDIHTHSLIQLPEAWSVYSVHADNFRGTNHSPFSIVVHPWYIDDISTQLSVVEKVALLDTNCVAIGETGIDKLRGVSQDIQIKVFRQQVLIAEQAKKPVIIHCVRSIDQLIGLKNELNPIMPWILHGYRGNSIQAVQLQKSGFYVSLGVGWLKRPYAFAEIVRSLDAERLFFESDEGDSNDIPELYSLAAKVFPDIEKKIVATTQKVFPTQFANNE